MSTSHPYRIQLHCCKQMNQRIKNFAEERGLSQSAAARLLIDKALTKDCDDTAAQIENLNRILSSILHASVVSRLMAAEAAKLAGSELLGDELKSRVARMLTRYQQFEKVNRR